VVDTDFLYDRAARLTDLTHRQGSTVLADYGWSYDAFSRVTSFSWHTDGSVSYSYDDTDQLTGADYSQLLDESFSYDFTGHRTMTGYVTGANNRLLSDGTSNQSYGVLWLLTDHLGNVWELAKWADVTGVMANTNHIVYGAFGGVMSESSASGELE